MPLQNELSKVKIKQFIENEKEFEFPEFIRCIRKAQGITRKKMSSDLGIHEQKIYYKENGKFSHMPEIDFLASVADYLGVPKNLLISKAKIFLLKKK